MHLFLDCLAGIAGDMTLAALIDLGAPRQGIVDALDGMGLGPWSLEVRREDAGHGLTGLQVHVHEGDQPLGEHEHEHSHETGEGGGDTDEVGDEHNHGHEHGHSHGHEHSHSDEHSHEETRRYREIQQMIAGAGLSDRARTRAEAVFARLARGEARVHGMTVEEVHFHEVGALDSIVDIVGVAIALDLLDVDHISVSPLPLSRGFTYSQHGRIPLPAPATLECLTGVPCFDSGLSQELVTPTGAALVGALANEYVRIPSGRPRGVGYGVGTRKLPDRPNLLRAVLLDSVAAGSFQREAVVELVAHIDDQTAEDLAYAVELLRAAGALDVWSASQLMKKGRLGQSVHVLARPDDAERLAEMLFRETTTLGVRTNRTERLTLARRQLSVETPFGAVRFKLGETVGGELLNLAAEADDIAACARQHGVSVKVVRDAANAAARQKLA